ncbi:MAG: HDOD domain-containing protein [Deltaproteobacteria bacterium]|nr:HDOD domain-containing protein [Deltaproteobacteria bacterium]
MKPTPELIVQSAEIPSIPKVLQQILALADRPTTSSADLEKYVTQEPALVVQLLKWVNSAAYALPQRVSSVAHAMILLGFSTVKSIASGMVLVNAFDEVTGLSKDYVRHVWRHTLAAAAFIKILTTKENNTRKDDFFLAAMLHDVGYLVLKQYFADKYNELLERAPYPSDQAEREVLGIDHVEVGAALLKDWKFAETVIDLVRHHHKSDDEYEGVKKDLYYLKISDELATKGDMKEYLFLKENLVEIDFLHMLRVIGWRWVDLQAETDNILQSLSTVEKLFE